ncbi:MFS transporter [Lactobacillus johnsonii]|uniref:MFS transporter n=1 Tax=Lactobacillus johnsonii TaxID=33959 RepID=UPI0028FC30CC|nr:MFS transporter [Lactobacillus johnsonii]MDD7006704.1 MFS transporter [Lactobacillus johnsonii]MDY5068026.1 MFS transporter [Lactobacillus johnsonii]MDY6196013.1 MFS transporter [Lactobacillus johnsonii]WNW29343.1 MFS transporter [Lactobacillus johnsonii]
MKSKSVNFKIAVLFLTFTAVFTLFRSSMSGIFSLFYAKNGIPNANISSIKSFQNIGIMLGLLPAGYLADRIGRLKVLSLSSIVIASSFLILILFRNFLFFSLAELLYGIGLALNSGTLIAYITDLQEQNQLSPNSKLMGMQVITLNLTTLIGGNIGTGLFAITDTAPVWFALIGLGLYPAFIFVMIKFLSFSDNKAAHKRKNNSIKNIASFFKKRNFWILLLLNVGYDCGTQFILIYWSIIYVEKLGFNLSLVYTLFMCALILGSLIFNRISTFASSRSITILNTLCMISVFVLSGILENKYLLLTLFLLIELLMGMMSGQISATSNEAIYGESNKSTMLSTVSFIAEILVSLSLFVSNAIMKWAGNLKVMFFVSAAYFSIVLLIIPLIKQKEELSTK